MDQLSEVLNRFSISAGVFYSGGLCGLSQFGHDEEQVGHLHLLKSGRINLHTDSREKIVIEEPSLLFYPQPLNHRIQADEEDKAEIVCASLKYGIGTKNPLTYALPPYILMPITGNNAVGDIAQWLFDEAFADAHARGAMMDRLCEILVIQLLRHVLASGETNGGLLAGLAHPAISKVLVALHKAPAEAWSLEDMAAVALLSRSKFAELFKQITKQTPAEYLTDWRIGIAQSLLKQNKPISIVANEVGYESGSTLARVFKKKLGVSPKTWQREATQNEG